MNKDRKKKIAKDGFQILKSRYGKLFGSAKPIAIGVGDEILERAKEGEKQKLKFALRRYCSGVNYLKAVRDGEYRYGLNGKRVSLVTEDDKKRAVKMIKAAYGEISKSNRR